MKFENKLKLKKNYTEYLIQNTFLIIFSIILSLEGINKNNSYYVMVGIFLILSSLSYMLFIFYNTNIKENKQLYI